MFSKKQYFVITVASCHSCIIMILFGNIEVSEKPEFNLFKESEKPEFKYFCFNETMKQPNWKQLYSAKFLQLS